MADARVVNAPHRGGYPPYLFLDDEHGQRGWRYIIFNLRKAWPLVPAHEDANMSGIDAMVTLLRHVYSVAGKTVSLELFTKLRRANPLLDFAAYDLIPVDRDGVLAIHAARGALLAQLCVQMNARPSELSFAHLDASPLMQETIWAQPRLQGFMTTAVKRRDGKLAFLEDDPDGAREEDVSDARTSESYCIWDTTVHKTLQDVVNSRDLFLQCEGGGREYILGRAKPMILRTLFDPTKQPIEGFGIQDIWKVDHPNVTAPVISRGSSRDGSWLGDFRRVADSRLSLVAVVRLRNTVDQSDYIRLYEPDGRPIPPLADARVHKSFYYRNWSVADQDHMYMLYHAPATDILGRDVALCGLAREVAPPRPDDRADDLRKLVERRFRDIDERIRQGEPDAGRDAFPYQPQRQPQPQPEPEPEPEPASQAGPSTHGTASVVAGPTGGIKPIWLRKEDLMGDTNKGSPSKQT